MKAYKDWVVQCTKHRTVVGKFTRDCGDIHYIAKGEFEIRPPIISLSGALVTDLGYGCPQCVARNDKQKEFLILRGEYWDVLGDVRPIAKFD